jgi:hypothetical protein
VLIALCTLLSISWFCCGLIRILPITTQETLWSMLAPYATDTKPPGPDNSCVTLDSQLQSMLRCPEVYGISLLPLTTEYDMHTGRDGIFDVWTRCAMQIIRGISIGLALMMYGQEEGSDGLTESMIHDQDPILRWDPVIWRPYLVIGQSCYDSS